MKQKALVISLLSAVFIFSCYLYSIANKKQAATIEIKQPIAAALNQQSMNTDVAIQYISYFRSTETAVRSVIQSVWIDDALIKYIAQHQASLNGLRIYIAKYQEGGAGGLSPDDARINKFTVILTPTVSSTKNGDPEDTDYFNYGSLCPQTCNGDVVPQLTNKKH